MDTLNSNPDLTESRPSTPSSYGSPLEPLVSTLNFHQPWHLSRASSFSGESSRSHQWSPTLTQNIHRQWDNHPGSPLLQSGPLPEWFQSDSWLHQDRQLEDLKICCDHLTKRNTELEAEVDTIKWVRCGVKYTTLIILWHFLLR